MTIFKKRLFCIVAACFMLILPFMSWGSGSTKEAKADSVSTLYEFDGSNLTFTSSTFDVWNTKQLTIGGEEINGTFFPLSNPVTLYGTDFIFSLAGNAGITFSLRFEDFFVEQEDVYLSGLTDVNIYYEFRIGVNSGAPVVYPFITELPTYNVYASDPVSRRLDIPSVTENPYFRFVDGYNDGYIVVRNSTINSTLFGVPIYRAQSILRFIRSSESFNADIYKIDIGHRLDMKYQSFIFMPDYTSAAVQSRIDLAVNYIRYYSRNGEWLEVQIPIDNREGRWNSYYLYDNRTYYVPGYNLSDTPSGDEGDTSESYWNGYNDGVFDGEANKEAAISAAINQNDKKWAGIVDERVSTALEAVKDTVFQEGFQAGASSEFGFGMFMTSVLDVLNIPIFGSFGLGDMFMVVFGVGIVLVVLKIFAGG